MTALVGGSVCRCAQGKRSFRDVPCSQEAKPDRSGAAARTLDPNQRKPLQRGRSAYIWESESESQKGNPGSILSLILWLRTPYRA